MKPRSLKPAVLVLAAVLILALLAAIVITQTARSRAEQAITLPGASYAPEEQPQTSTGESLAEITPQNVQAVLAQTLARPTFYHQILTATLRADDFTRTQQIELWRQDALLQADITQDDSVRHLLTDGQTLYVWYDDETAPSVITLDGSVNSDELLGVPTYEALTELPRTAITGAEVVSLTEPDEPSCLFVSCVQSGVRQEYWVSLTSGLLCKQITYSGEEPMYTVEQTLSERLTAGDEAAQALFALTARAEDQYVLAYPDLRQAKGGSAWTEGPVIL